jgi:hypothetical protein
MESKVARKLEKKFQNKVSWVEELLFCAKVGKKTINR